MTMADGGREALDAFRTEMKAKFLHRVGIRDEDLGTGVDIAKLSAQSSTDWNAAEIFQATSIWRLQQHLLELGFHLDDVTHCHKVDHILALLQLSTPELVREEMSPLEAHQCLQQRDERWVTQRAIHTILSKFKKKQLAGALQQLLHDRPCWSELETVETLIARIQNSGLLNEQNLLQVFSQQQFLEISGRFTAEAPFSRPCDMQQALVYCKQHVKASPLSVLDSSDDTSMNNEPSNVRVNDLESFSTPKSSSSSSSSAPSAPSRSSLVEQDMLPTNVAVDTYPVAVLTTPPARQINARQYEISDDDSMDHDDIDPPIKKAKLTRPRSNPDHPEACWRLYFKEISTPGECLCCLKPLVFAEVQVGSIFPLSVECPKINWVPLCMECKAAIRTTNMFFFISDNGYSLDLFIQKIYQAHLRAEGSAYQSMEDFVNVEFNERKCLWEKGKDANTELSFIEKLQLIDLANLQ
eukprot:GILJ01008841.1.p1 GENE.GILJ01008841.1~~GILJ01008841.1.p1  ORF type:complete len:468 (-),score=65.31 GILJ01008841.1:31-1434(-)